MATYKAPLKNPKLLPMMGMIWLIHKLGLWQKFVFFKMKRMNNPKQKVKAFANYNPTKHDVVVATFSKSGTNWTMQIAYQIAHYGQGDFVHVHDVVPWPEAPIPGGVPLLDKSAQNKAPTGLRIIKTHLESHYVPYNHQAKYLTVIRDPKDVFVSSYFFARNTVLGDYMPSLEDWLTMYLSNKFLMGLWAEHTASFWAWRNRENVLVVTFEEMKKDLATMVHRIANLMELSLTEKQHAQVVEKSSFGYMQSIDHKFAPPVPSFIKKDDDKPLMISKGKSKRGRELLTVEQLDQIDQFYQAELHRLGSDFPYSKFF